MLLLAAAAEGGRGGPQREHLRLESGQAVLKTNMYATKAYLAPLAFEITLRTPLAPSSKRSIPRYVGTFVVHTRKRCLGNAASDNICEIAVACVCVCVACINACVYDVRVFQTMADAESTSCLCTSECATTHPRPKRAQPTWWSMTAVRQRILGPARGIGGAREA